MNRTHLQHLLFAGILVASALFNSAVVGASGWPITEGQPGGGRYSPLDEINTQNVHLLEEIWRYRHGDYFEGSFPINRGTSFITTPIIVGDLLIFTTPTARVIALNAETGEERWIFDPELDREATYANMWANRGVSVWRGSSDDKCSPRVFLTTLDARLIALDAKTGSPCENFSAIELRADITPIFDKAEYGATSPSTVVGDVVVVGSSIPDMIRPNSPPGKVRGFDARTGQLIWTFNTIPQDGEYGRDTWLDAPSLSGAANVWTTMAADEERGLVYLPVSTASPDHYGGDRKGNNLFSDSVVALDAKTGRRIWHYQAIRHDLWDYDLASPPILFEHRRGDIETPALVQLTKSGLVFVLDRTTGEPLFPVVDSPVPDSDVPGEVAAKTQPIPTLPKPLLPLSFDDSDLYKKDSDHFDACQKRLSELRFEGTYTPPSLEGTLIYPATGGGPNWPGAAFDPNRRIMVVPIANLAIEIRLEHVSDEGVSEDGGARPMQGISIRNLWWLLTGQGTGYRYRVKNGHELFAHNGTPCNKPPWGQLVAIDLDTGEKLWDVSTSSGSDDLGNSTLQPPLITGGGLVFHGGSWWPRLRIHDSETGQLIKTMDMPAGVHGGTITYKTRPNARQYLVVSAGGHDQLGSPKGDYIIAYALPAETDSE